MPLTGCKVSLNLKGPEWMIWRSAFNTGFSVKNIMLLIPSFVEDSDVFKSWLSKVASPDEVAPLDNQASALVSDIKGRAVLYVPSRAALLSELVLAVFRWIPRTPAVYGCIFRPRTMCRSRAYKTKSCSSSWTATHRVS